MTHGHTQKISFPKSPELKLTHLRHRPFTLFVPLSLRQAFGVPSVVSWYQGSLMGL